MFSGLGRIGYSLLSMFVMFELLLLLQMNNVAELSILAISPLLVFPLLLFMKKWIISVHSMKIERALFSLVAFFLSLFAGAETLLITHALFPFAPSLAFSLANLIFTGSLFASLIIVDRIDRESLFSLFPSKEEELTKERRNIVIDRTVLDDPRFFDLAASGLLDDQLVLPQSLLDEIQQESREGDIRAKKSEESVKRLETMDHLHLRIVETPYRITSFESLILFAKKIKGSILTMSDTRETLDGQEVRIINLQLLANTLKPMTQMGELLEIKVQRYGKEARQGVGYLDDGTMVVVNGGAEFLGETIKAKVLSIKHTTSGRMIFCNSFQETYSRPEKEKISHESGNGANRYFAL